ncbi:hypothetical protein CYMTET_18288 [Cymbomonas tetramitiformis]|uniref:Uncharacterized protein n=1 Tax=Cymbomonas tetramitiformis TaxID=36881 RepID=A0AAE0G8D4_9CHLO|nr:hypothetical protein CYMTET_18288 [Cymbomonas tetramitiformis]
MGLVPEKLTEPEGEGGESVAMGGAKLAQHHQIHAGYCNVGGGRGGRPKTGVGVLNEVAVGVLGVKSAVIVREGADDGQLWSGIEGLVDLGGTEADPETVGVPVADALDVKAYAPKSTSPVARVNAGRLVIKRKSHTAENRREHGVNELVDGVVVGVVLKVQIQKLVDFIAGDWSKHVRHVGQKEGEVTQPRRQVHPERGQRWP